MKILRPLLLQPTDHRCGSSILGTGSPIFLNILVVGSLGACARTPPSRIVAVDANPVTVEYGGRQAAPPGGCPPESAALHQSGTWPMPCLALLYPEQS